MTAHTAAPWRVRPSDLAIVNADASALIAWVDTIKYGKDAGEIRANAAVIAAAPDMLKALKAIFEHCVLVHKHWGENSNQREASAAEQAARAAIAKATAIDTPTQQR